MTPNGSFTLGQHIKIFAGNGSPGLAAEIAGLLGAEVSKSRVKRFADGEISVDLDETVRGATFL